jgi:nicotinate-nucleotide--dimethylbenzimidazole phosphoribosyltransferase
MESTDGTGATLAWPMVKSAAALLTEVADGEDPGPSRPGEFDAALPFEETVKAASPFGDALY